MGEGATWVLEQVGDSYHLAALTDGAQASIINEYERPLLLWRFKTKPLDLRVKWQQWLMKAEKEVFTTLTKLSSDNGTYSANIKLQFQSEAKWPYVLKLELIQN